MGVAQKKLKAQNSKLKTAMKHYLWLFFLIIILFFKTTPSFAESSYVLPYPPPLPGSFFYKIRLVSEQIQKYWYFGNFGQFHYSLKQSDKYLVEAKTLFDYKQYLLALRALKKSDSYFGKIHPNLLSAKNKGKNISEKQTILKGAAQKHIEELTKLKSTVPSVFDWTPERESPIELNLWESLDSSIKLRVKRL